VGENAIQFIIVDFMLTLMDWSPQIYKNSSVNEHGDHILEGLYD